MLLIVRHVRQEERQSSLAVWTKEIVEHAFADFCILWAWEVRGTHLMTCAILRGSRAVIV